MKNSRKDKNALYWKIGVVSIVLSITFFIVASLLP